MKRRYDAIPDRFDHRDHVAMSSPPMTKFQSVDLRQWMPGIRDQGEEGSCTAFAGVRLLSWLTNRFTGKALEFSPQFLYRAERIIEGTRDEDSGAQSRTMVAVLRDTGCCLESSLPYSDKGWKTPTTQKQLAEAQLYRTGAFHRIPDLYTLRSVLSSGYPAALAIEVYESFESDTVSKTGRVPMPKHDENLLGYHEVVVAGMDEHSKHLLVANSWGVDWGYEGYFWLPYEYWEFHVCDSWLAHLGPAWKATNVEPRRPQMWPFNNNKNLERKLDQVLQTQKQILELVRKEMASIDTLTQQVQANTDVEASAVTLIQGIAAQLAAAGTDPVKLQALQDQLKNSADALAAAVVANTPQA